MIFALSALLQLFAGGYTVGKVMDRILHQQKKFEYLRKLALTSEQSRRLVHTLIPENVMAKLTYQEDGEFLGVEIPRCIAMFCALEPQTELKTLLGYESFNLLDRIFQEFDEAVQASGMYKYQHVGDWYIVTCPRVTQPFDRSVQEAEYPRSYFEEMCSLAQELEKRASKFEINGSRLTLRVGLHCGPAAGAVVGLHRAFYCVYGDTINTAARMCKYAQCSQMLCTREFAEELEGLATQKLTAEFHARINVKGKGEMDVFQVFVDSVQQVQSPITLKDIQLQGDGGCSRLLMPLRRPWELFSNPTTEFNFRSEQARDHWITIATRLLLHFIAVLSQLNILKTLPLAQLCPLDPPAASRCLLLMQLTVLAVHASTITCYFVFTVRSLWQELKICPKFYRHFIISKISCVCFAVIANQCFANDRITVIFSAILVFTNLITCGKSLWSLLFMALLGTISSAAILTLDMGLARTFVIPIALSVTLLVTQLKSRALELTEGNRLHYYKVMEFELGRFESVLRDLLPVEQDDFLKRRVRDRLAVVLQLDVCNFTQLSADMAPLALARAMHELFSSFDQLVLDRGLFKIDTVGDAYVVVGWLPEERGEEEGEDEAKLRGLDVCRSVVSLAQLMVEEARACGMACRVGVAVGSVAAGVRGSMQSRFHIEGAAMQEAELLERRSKQNAVHVSWKLGAMIGRRRNEGEGAIGCFL